MEFRQRVNYPKNKTFHLLRKRPIIFYCGSIFCAARVEHNKRINREFWKPSQFFLKTANTQARTGTLAAQMANELSSRSLFLTVFEAGSLIVLNVLALLGNILVCISVYRNTRLRTTTNLYIIALAVSDLLSAIFVMPLSTGVLISSRWPFGETLCQMSGFITVFVVYASPVTMGLTALNRFVRICKSDQQYKRIFSPKKSRGYLAATWMTVAFYILFVRLTDLQEFRFVPRYAVCLNVHLSEVVTIIHYFIVVGLFFMLPLAVTIFSYRRVYKKIREH